MSRLIILTVVFATALCQRSVAQTFSVDWYKVSGGGGVNTGGVFQVSGTAGQHDASGPMNGGVYSITGGFWALVQVVQTPGAPALQIGRSGGNLTVFWQNVGSWTLQQNGNLALTNGWNNSIGVTIANGTNYLTIPNPAGSQFFRLK
jgi:hypothetical protein